MRKRENGKMRERHALPHFLIFSFPHFRNPIFPHSHITFARPAYQTNFASWSLRLMPSFEKITWTCLPIRLADRSSFSARSL